MYNANKTSVATRFSCCNPQNMCSFSGLERTDILDGKINWTKLVWEYIIDSAFNAFKLHNLSSV